MPLRAQQFIHHAPAALLDMANTFAQHIKEWERLSGIGSSCLQQLQSGLQQLRVQPNSKNAAEQLHELVPSKTLAAYIASGCKQERYQSQDLASDLQNVFLDLNTAMHSLRHIVDCAQTAGQQYCDELDHVPKVPRRDLFGQPSIHEAEEVSSSNAALAADSTGNDAAAEVCGPGGSVDGVREVSGGLEGDATSDDGHVEMAAEEVGLLMQMIVKAMRKQLQVMEMIVAAVSLDVPPEELYTYVHIWDLQPYMQDAACELMLVYVDTNNLCM